MRLFLFCMIFGFLGINSSFAQIFSWENPNIKDSLKVDSLISAKMNKDFFKRDTVDFIKHPQKRIIDDAVLIKADRKRILGELTSKGSIIRGLSFGNNQGSAVQSSMDLQIGGKLSKDVSILASIYDHSLPVQADGYTQTLEDFDRIFIQLNIKDKTILRAGHIDLIDDKTYFGKYQRRSLGLEFQTEFGEENKTFTDLSIGVARSEFHRMRFQGVEGNQGPYRLRGKNGENFITIISGSEQVFIDGILMKRGEDADYIINYNTGELSFTSLRPIYKQNFISVSYNYTNRNYSRFLVTGGLRHERERFKGGIKWFLETDNKNAPLALNLSKEDEKILSLAGNNTQLMYAPSAREAEYDVNKILYRKISSPHGDYFEFSNDKNEKLYEVSFNYFGKDKGDYKLMQTTNNGRVFQYVGKQMGDYSAVRKLPSPERRQVLSVNGEYLLDDSDGKIGADLSLSNYDINLFSSKDNDQNTGYAGRIFAQKSFKKGDWTGTPSLEFQRIDGRFHILDRINGVEFSRDFNLPQEFNHKTQNRLIFSFDNRWSGQSFINYKLNYLSEKASYTGIKNDIDFVWEKGRILTQGKISYLNTKGAEEQTNFIRGSVESQLKGDKGSWSIGGSMEHNLRRIEALGGYDASSFSWKEVFLQKKIGDTARTKLLAKIYFRDNDSIQGNRLQNFNHILGLEAEAKLIKTEKTELSTALHYRKFFYQNGGDGNTHQDFILGNISYNQQLFSGGLRFQTLYELGNGQEAQRAFQYIKVTDGQGVYKWTDYNGDGIQQLDEFEIAEYSDLAQYIRVYTDSVRYLPSNKNRLQFSVFLNPHQVFYSENPFLKRWNFNFSFSVDNSFLKNNKTVAFNPFERGDIMRSQNLLASATFNSNEKSGWSGSYRFTDNQNLINANFSIEDSHRAGHFLNIGYRFNEYLKADWENKLGKNTHYSQIFATRNYKISIIETRPKATYQLSQNTEAELSAAYINKDRTDGEEYLRSFDFTGAVLWTTQKTSLRGSFSLINNYFTGNSFSVVANQMLDGLKAGTNKVWSLHFHQAITSIISLSIGYEGRMHDDRTIHTGSMQLKANF